MHAGVTHPNIAAWTRSNWTWPPDLWPVWAPSLSTFYTLYLLSHCSPVITCRKLWPVRKRDVNVWSYLYKVTGQLRNVHFLTWLPHCGAPSHRMVGPQVQAALGNVAKCMTQSDWLFNELLDSSNPLWAERRARRDATPEPNAWSCTYKLSRL